MRRKVSLYIGNQLVDLDEQSFILFNYTMEDLSNPTIVRNSFSKQITLKGTQNNNKIFGGLFRMDRQTQYGDSHTGVNFDAARKTPFAIYNEMNEVVESGYVRLDEVVKAGRQVEYKITLYGGLGSFFYGLMYNDEGEKKTLADLVYPSYSGQVSRPGGIGLGGYEMLVDCWSYLQDPETYVTEYEGGVRDNWWADIITFVPAYNGLPEGFSANKALVKNNSFDNVPYGKLIDGTQYTFKEGTSTNLMLMTNPHSEWEINDLRWYLQRPAIRLKAIIEAICESSNNGGYSVELEEEFFSADNPLYYDAWITLPMIPIEKRTEADAIRDLLESTKSPAEYLISYAKTFGLLFVAERESKSIRIMQRKKFYDDSLRYDLTERIDVGSIKISPIIASSHFYQFGADAIGEWAEDYRAEYGRDYAIQRINTGNEMNYETEIVTKDIIFKDAVEVQERSLLFTSNYLSRDDYGGKVENFILPMYESVKIQLWGTKDGDTEQSMQEVDILSPYEWERFFNNPGYPLSDWLPKVQFHGKDNKPTDGSDVLVVFNGMKETPVWAYWARLEYRLTDDLPDMETLNEGVPCWNFTDLNSRIVTTLPSFRRCTTYDIDGDDVIESTFEWGEPMARGVNGVFHHAHAPDNIIPATLYNEYWKKYLTDRYDDDTFKMTCKVNLRGLRVGQELMRGFFYYQGAYFVLNKITNYSLTTWDDVECEFIKVQDITNYKN